MEASVLCQKGGGFKIAVWCNVTCLSAGNFWHQTCHNSWLIARSAQAVYDRVVVVLYTYFTLAIRDIGHHETSIILRLRS